MIRTLTRAGVLAMLVALQSSPTQTTAPAQPPAPHELARPSDLITVQHGTLPIIISAPHGGQCRVPGSKDRTTGVTVRDDMTSELALLVAQRITSRLGQKPSFVIAQFSRKDADANRAPDAADAYENPAAAAQHAAYHAALRTLVDEAATHTPGAILIDLHGQKREPDAIVRGTRDGKTVSRLLARAGDEALTGPDSICGRLSKAGYRILPSITDPAENERHPLNEKFFDGGYIVAHYGSDPSPNRADLAPNTPAAAPKTIDAIQLEIGRMRSTETLKLARELGDAIVAFHQRYLVAPVNPNTEQGSRPPAPSPEE